MEVVKERIRFSEREHLFLKEKIRKKGVSISIFYENLIGNFKEEIIIDENLKKFTLEKKEELEEKMFNFNEITKKFLAGVSVADELKENLKIKKLLIELLEIFREKELTEEIINSSKLKLKKLDFSKEQKIIGTSFVLSKKNSDKFRNLAKKIKKSKRETLFYIAINQTLKIYDKEIADFLNIVLFKSSKLIGNIASFKRFYSNHQSKNIYIFFENLEKLIKELREEIIKYKIYIKSKQILLR